MPFPTTPTPVLELVVKEFKDLFRKSFPQKNRSGKVGRPTIAPKWLIAGVLVLGKAYNMTYREIAQWTAQPQTYRLLQAQGLTAKPCFQTLHDYFKNMNKSSMERLVKKIALSKLWTRSSSNWWLQWTARVWKRAWAVSGDW